MCNENSKIKYYMNNPCEVVREVSSDFSEVKVYPQFDEDMNGGDWCIQCMVGDQGTPSSHTCGEYQEVLEVIRDSEPAMVVIVENRLLCSEPVEFKAWKLMRERTEKMRNEHRDISNDKFNITQEIKTRSQLLVDVNEEIEDAKSKVSSIYDEISNSSRNLSTINDLILEKQDQVSIGRVQISLTGDDIKRMIRAEIKLQHLENGGVDNWEWYGESLPDSDEIEKQVQHEIESLSVKGF